MTSYITKQITEDTPTMKKLS